MKHRAFTITELLVVIVIVVAITAISIPVFVNARNKAERIACIGNLREIGVGLELYLGDNNNIMPGRAPGDPNSDEENAASIHILLADHVDSDSVFHCPADAKLFAESGSSYFWNPLISGQHRLNLDFLGSRDRPDSIPLVTDKEAFHGERNGTNILYANYITSKEVKFVAGN